MFRFRSQMFYTEIYFDPRASNFSGWCNNFRPDLTTVAQYPAKIIESDYISVFVCGRTRKKH